MNEKLFEEDLSISYLRAIAAKAKVTFELNHRDSDSKDVDLRKIIQTDDGGTYAAEFSVQLKATYADGGYVETDDSIKYPLKAKNYNDLCRKGTTNIILCLLILPKDSDEWVSQTDDELVLKRCMYWISLNGKEPTENKSTVTVEIPKENVMSVEALNEMMRIVMNRGEI